jgi:hypothetical protein
MRRFGLVIASVLLGCGGSKGGGGDDQQMADAPPLTGDKYELHWGPVTVHPSVENTQCIWLKLSNPTEIKVHQLHNTLEQGSHHLIVYKDDMDTTEQTTPVDCQPFTGALNASGKISPIMITQKHDDELTLPDGVAYTIPAGQMIKLELHYINATDADLQVAATVDFFSADPATIHDAADLLFVGSPDISLPPNMMTTLHQFFTVPSYVDFSSSKIFAITGHEHKLGTDVEVNVGQEGGQLTSVYKPNPFVWSEPVTQTSDPGFSIPSGGGLDFTCTWMNTTAGTVRFGESANDEMCFFWAYYYPSQGSKVCIHTADPRAGGNLNACCPGDSLCSFINMMF